MGRGVEGLADKYPEHVLTKWLGNTPKIAKEHYLQVTDEHWMRAVLEDTSHVQGGTECAPVLSGLVMNRTAQGFSGKVVSVDSAIRNTHTPKRAGVRDGRDRIRTCVKKTSLAILKTQKTNNRH